MFLNLRAEEVGVSSAIIRFETSVAAYGEVEYGLMQDALDSVVSEPTAGAGSIYILEHEVPLVGLLPSITYFCRARATAPGGVMSRSELSRFSTLGVDPMPTDPINVAQLSAGAVVVSTSSNYGGAAQNEPWGGNQAIDGDLSTEWATAGDGDAASLTIDLGQERTIVAVGYRGRQMFDGTGVVTSIQVVFDGENIAGPFATPDPAQVYRFDLIEPVTTRTARFEAVTSSGGLTGARELQLFAVPS
jgi:hypothetical protein